MLKTITSGGMIILLAGCVGLNFMNTVLAQEGEKSLPPYELSRLIYDVVELEESIEEQQWDVFLHELVEIRKNFENMKPELEKRGLKEPGRRFDLIVSLLEQAAVQKDLSELNENILYLSRLVIKMRKNFALVPLELGVLMSWIDHVRECVIHDEWDEIYEELEKEEIGRLIVSLDNLMSSLEQGETKYNINSLFANLNKDFSGHNADSVMRSVNGMKKEIEALEILFAKYWVDESPGVMMMLAKCQDAQEAIQGSAWERAEHELTKIDELIIELRQEGNLSNNQIEGLKKTVAQTLEAVALEDKDSAEGMIVNLRDFLEKDN